MKRGWITVVVISAFVSVGFSQKTTNNNYTGAWENSATWVGNVPAAVTDIANADLNLTINGFVTRNGNLTFAANNDGEDFIINDTLVIRGSISFANKAANLRLGPNSVFIVFGNFSASNKIVVENGGIFIVTGDVNFSPSGQDDYSNPGGGEIYVGGSVSGNDDAEEGETNWDDLADDYPEIFEYVECGGGPSCILPVQILYFSTVTDGSTVSLKWATVVEEGFLKFVVQRADENLLFENIGEVAGKGFDIHNIESKYTFTDQTPLLGFNYYRLKAVDLDDSFEYFGPKLVKIQGPKNVEVHPNPSTGEAISLRFNFNPQESDRVVVMNSLGVELGNFPATGAQKIVFPEKLNSGIYLVRYRSGDTEHVNRIVIKN